MNALKDFGNITIIGRRWFERTYGNTYHSVQVFVDGELIGEVPFEYGYGDHYIQTASQILRDKGYYSKTKDSSADYGSFIEDQREHRNKFVISVTDVQRKKDL